MNNTVFFNDFVFTEFCFNTFRHNDVTSGIVHHYIAYMREGHCSIVTDKGIFHVNEGEFFYLPKHFKYHSNWYAGSGGVVRFDSYGFKTMPQRGSIVYEAQAIPSFPEAVILNEKLAQNKTVDFQSVGLFYQLLGLLVNKMVCVPEDRKSTIVQKAEEYMQENTDCTAPDIAKHCGISQTALYEAFKTVRGYTPVTARHKIVVERACELLRTTDMPVREIIEQLGFGSEAYFRKIFFQQTHKTPRQLRREPIL